MALSQFAKNFDINDPTSTRYCLGGDVYISISYYRSDYKIHIRRFNTVPDTQTGKIFMFPSKTGLMLSMPHLHNLLTTLPTVLDLVTAQRDGVSDGDGATVTRPSKLRLNPETPRAPTKKKRVQ